MWHCDFDSLFVHVYTYIYIRFVDLKVKGRVTEVKGQRKGEKRQIFYLLAYFPNGCNSQNWANLKPGFRSFMPVFHVCGGAQALEPSSAPSWVYCQGAESKLEQQGIDPPLIWNATLQLVVQSTVSQHCTCLNIFDL